MVVQFPIVFAMANSPSIPSPSLGVSTKLSTIEEAEANGIKAEIYPTIFQKVNVTLFFMEN